jgi:sterol-4alpha-carboxylate 3-dehydrogenase (decarboxylating)
MSSNDVPPAPHILVIGGCGFLGSHIVQALLTHSPAWKVSVASRSPTQNLYDGASYYTVDISKKAELETLLLKLLPTIIVNTASPLAHAGARASTVCCFHNTKYLIVLGVREPRGSGNTLSHM